MDKELDKNTELANARKERESVEDEYFQFRKLVHQTEGRIEEIEAQLFRLEENDDGEFGEARSEFRNNLLRNLDGLDESNLKVKKKFYSKFDELDDKILEIQNKEVEKVEIC